MTKERKGFTLIEMLIVVVIIGILAAIAIPKFSNTKEKAIVATLKSDVRGLEIGEEAFSADSGTYTTSLTKLNVQATPGNVLAVGDATGTGYFVSVSNGPSTCAVGVGSDSTMAGAQDGVIKCVTLP